MKKSLSVLLSAAIAFSAFAGVASAADPVTAQEKFDYLKEKKIFAGINAAGDAGLDQKMTRAQFARALGLLKGNNVDAEPAKQDFKDVPPSHWAYQEVGAALAANLMVGVGGGKFNPNGNIEVQQLAVALVQALGLTPVAGATVEGSSAYAGPYIKALQNAGFNLPTTYKAAATRELLVTASFDAYVALNPAAVVKIASAAATSAKKITVTFNTAVDTAKAKISVLNGTNVVNSKSITFADDKKSAVIEFASNLAAATYTVKVEGLTETALTAEVKVEAEKVAKIEFTSDKASLSRSDNTVVTAGYKVLNQYNEEINNTTLSATAGKGSANAASGKVTIDAATPFILGEKVVVSLVHTSGAFATATLEVGSVAQVATIDIVKLYQADNKELVAGSDADFKLVLDLKDQYNNSVTDLTYLNNGSDVLVTVSNPTVADLVGYTNNNATFSLTNIDGKNQVTLTLKNGANLKAGTSTVTLISKSTGGKDTFDLVVKEDVKVDTLTLTAPAVAAAGDTVNIPYTAVDQSGNTIAHPTAAMINGASSSVAGAEYQPSFIKDVVKNVTNLKVKLPNTTGTIFVTVFTGTNKVAQVSINVTEARKAAVISGVKDLDTAILLGGSVELGTGNVVVKDQYGDDFGPTFGTAAGNFRVKVETSDASKVSSSSTTAPSTLTAQAKGSSSITLTLEQNVSGTWTALDNSSYTFTEKVVSKADISSYEATVAGTVYEGGAAADYGRDLTVTGILADGSKVTVTNSTYNYTVHEEVAGLNYAAGKFSATNEYTGNNGDTATTEESVLVTVIGNDNQEVKVVKVKISRETPRVETLELETNGVATKEDTNVASVAKDAVNANFTGFLNNAIKAVDQYGVTIADPAFTFVTGNFSNSSRASTNTVNVGDTFTVTAIGQGKSISFKVIVK